MTYEFIVQIKNKTINCRAFTLREYKDLLQAKLEKRMEPAIIELLNKCTDAKGLNKQEAELLLINLWSNSLGAVNVEHTWVCECGKEQDIPVTISRASIVDESEVIRDFGAFKIKFRYPGLFEDGDKGKMIACCIEYIITEGGERIVVDDLNEAEIEDLYNAITLDDINALMEELLKPQVQMAIPISCECGAHSVHVIKGLKEFFKFM